MRCLDVLIMISLASFVSISLPVSFIVISDYMNTRTYEDGTCNGSTLANYTTYGGFFFHGIANVQANVSNTLYSGYLYYPPIKHWQLGVMSQDDIDNWYDSLNKTGNFKCYVDLSDPSHPMINEWISIYGYYLMLIFSLFILCACSGITCFIYSHQLRRRYTQISDDLPPPYTPTKQYSLNNSTTISL